MTGKLDKELEEECMPTIERFEEEEKQTFFPVPAPKDCRCTIRIYSATMVREAITKAIPIIKDSRDAEWVSVLEKHKVTVDSPESLAVAVDVLIEGAKKAEREKMIDNFHLLSDGQIRHLKKRLGFNPNMCETCAGIWETLEEEK